MEEAFRRAIRAIEAETGMKPKRIDMPDGRHLINFMGVELLIPTSMWVKMRMLVNVHKEEEEEWPTGI